MTKTADYRTDLLARKNVYDRIMRVWSPHLDSYELHVVMVLAATSMSFGYESIELSHAGMLAGVTHRERPNEWFIPKMNVSDKTLRRSLESLKAKGIVDYTFTGRANCYKVNWKWEPAMGVPTPKRLKNRETGCKTETSEEAAWSVGPSSSVRGTEQFGTSDLLYTRDVNKTSKQENQGSAGASRLAVPKKSANRSAPNTGAQETKKVSADNVADRMEEHRQKMAAENLKRVANARKKDHSGAFEVTWKAAWQDAFPSDPCIGWTKEQRGMINGARTRFASTPEEYHAFLDFAVRQWNVLRATTLKWMTTAPVSPAVGVLVKYLPDFASAFAESRLAAKSQFTKTEEETIADLVRNHGKTYEEAISAVAEQRGRTLERRDTHKLRQQAERTVQLAHEQAQQAAAALAAAKRERTAAPAAPVFVHPDDTKPELDAQTDRVFADIAALKDDGFVWK